MHIISMMPNMTLGIEYGEIMQLHGVTWRSRRWSWRRWQSRLHNKKHRGTMSHPLNVFVNSFSRHHLHITTILPLCHSHQSSNDEIIKAILITILPAPGRLSLSAETCQRTTLTQLSVTSNHFLQLQAFVFHTFVCLANVYFCHCLCLFPETSSCF